MGFSMEVVDTEAIKEEIVEQVKPVPEEVKKLKEQAEKNANQLINLNMDSIEERKSIVKTIDEFGLDTIQKSANKNSLLQVSVGSLSKIGGESGQVAQDLSQLQKEMKDLDPSLIDFTNRGLLGKIFNPIRAYFSRFEKAEDVINDIIKSLDKGKATLKNDNTTLEIEEVALRDLTKKLNKEIQLGTMLDQAISREIEIAKSRNEDEDKIRFISEEILFPLRQRLMDMQQMVVVNHQGIMAIEVLRRNNKELIRGVDRAKNVTVSALRIAVLVASALYNQKIVLKKIQILNETTNNLISNTSKMLKEQGAEIHKQSMESTLSVDALKTAFQDVLDALDSISAYKQEALPKMKETIEEFKVLSEKGEKEIQKLEKGSKINNY
ncbi:MAG: toxic anion resistance protein [Clostridia bacterium]|jgi:uncharacterized protein YaaN involved in tellurite resistance|nr:toxic anion resistance protein [Clostridia bacterium]